MIKRFKNRFADASKLRLSEIDFLTKDLCQRNGVQSQTTICLRLNGRKLEWMDEWIRSLSVTY